MANSVSNHKDFLTTKEAATLLGFKTNTLEIWRTKGKGPQFIKVGNGARSSVRYLRSTLLEWLESQTHVSTSSYSVQTSAK
ncbi:DNA-binding protein [Acinetobacter baumannii]|uniref:helix-turn-helix transcriptional regulator n=1 Tax=Acinetobacter baumannii TaxID=470 RepID=UPI0010212D6B|nr:helix-turn-helix domain-containing protein [Acinetobacter baumannii]QBC46982.1 DNA-binding protein [Acinetobacter baumannii]